MSPRRAAPQKKSRGLPTWVLAIAIAVVVVAGVVVLFVLQSSAGGPAPASTGLSAPGRTIGNPNSKVAFVEYSDFQ